MTVRGEIAQSPIETGERRARLPGRRADRVQACRSSESAIAAEAFMDNAG
jgi:hypothetical protein